MERVWSGSRLFAPFLRIGSRRNIMFPDTGSEVPFRIECWAYVDSFGRETLTLHRSFGLKTTRRFDEYVVRVPSADSLVIYAGTHQHLAVAFDVRLSSRGGVELRTGRQRLFTPVGALRYPLLLSGEASVVEWYDEDLGRFHIDGRVRNRIFGGIFGFSGSYESRLERVPDSGIPAGIRPVKEESRW